MVGDRWYARGMEPREPYPTDLTDRAWQLSQPYVPQAKPGGHPEKYPTRAILNGIFSIVRGGCAWRLWPHDFPPWPIVYQYCWRWQQDGTWPVRHDRLRGDVRVAAGKPRQPRAGIIESPSVKTTAQGGSAALMRTHRSRGAHAISWSRREGGSSASSSPPPVCKTGTAPCPCWRSDGTTAPACA